MKSIDYEQAVAWLDSMQQFGMKPGLDRIQVLLDQLGHPEDNLSVIHVAGTNGKGSVCRYIHSILGKEGYRVGLFTSPHLESVRERFYINETMISEKEFIVLISALRDIVIRFESEAFQPTYFELCTALAFLFFKNHQVDYVVLEVGLGGRYDATNVVDPLLCIITNIFLDHQQVLGDTIEEIAAEKAGIIKDCVPVVTGAQQIALAVIEEEVKSHHGSLVVVDDTSSNVLEQTLDHQRIKVEGMLDEYDLVTHEIGGYQRHNLAIVIHAIEQLQLKGVFISPESIHSGVESMIHPGRMKIVHTNPLVIIDGAHNPSGMVELKRSIENLFPNRKITLIFGILNDKDVQEMISAIHPLCTTIIIAKPSHERAADPSHVKKIASGFFSSNQIKISSSIQNAVQQGFTHVKKDEILIIAGSLYLIAPAMKQIKSIN